MVTFTGRRIASEGTTWTGASTATFDEVSDEARLIVEARAGDASAFAELYSRHVADVSSLARRLCRDRYEADDVVSEVFCNTLRALRRGSGPSDDLRPYLLRSVRNQIVKVRTRGDTGRADLTATDRLDRPDATDDFVAPGEAAVAFGSVSDRYQRVLWSVEVEGTPTTTIAMTEDVSPPAAASLAYRARCALRRAYIGASIAAPPSATCQPIRSMMPTFVDGGLGTKNSAAVRAHCADCSDCGQVLERAEHLRAGLSDRSWWALAPLGIRAALVTAGRSVVGAVVASPLAATVAVVSGIAALTVGSVAIASSDESLHTSVPAIAVVTERTSSDDPVVEAEVDGNELPTVTGPIGRFTPTGAPTGTVPVDDEQSVVDDKMNPKGSVIDGTDAFDDLGLPLSDVLDLPVANDSTGPIVDVVGAVVTPVVADVVNPVVETVVDVVGSVVAPVTHVVNPLIEPVVEPVQPLIETVQSVVEPVQPAVEVVQPVVVVVEPVDLLVGGLAGLGL